MVPQSDLGADDSEMDAAVRFYTGVLGLNLTNRYGDKWATVEARRNLVIGLLSRTARSPVPATKSSVMLGLMLSVGHRTELFDASRSPPPPQSDRPAATIEIA